MSFYNNERPHSILSNRTPNSYESEYFSNSKENRNVKLNTDGSSEKVKCVLIFDFDLFSLYVFNHTIY